jgi:predicted glycosyltransferase
MRIAFYVQHLQGTGHLKRTSVLCKALSEAGHEVSCFSGGTPIKAFDFGKSELIQLPPAKAADLTYKLLVDERGKAVDEKWMNARRDFLLASICRRRPEIIVTESFPFGRRLLQFELEPLLHWVETTFPRIGMAVSIRDILDGFPGPDGRMQTVIDRLRRCYHRVMVHGDPRWVRLEDTFPAAPDFADLIRYTGYVADPATATSVPNTLGEILVSTGGGVVGGKLARTAVAAANLDRDSDWHILLGDNLPEMEFAGLVRAAGKNTIVERNRTDYPQLLAAARLSVSQAGYNTIAEILATSVPAVVVPFSAPGQLEQTRRADLVAKQGRAVVVDESELTPAALLAAVQQTTTLPVLNHCVDVDGARRSVEILEELYADWQRNSRN